MVATAALFAGAFLVAFAFLAASFFGAFFAGIGMVMPGIAICAAAGAANSPPAPNRSNKNFSGKSFLKRPRPIDRGRSR